MCGIVGAINKPSDLNFEEMMNMLSHRGPDSRGSYEDDNVALGHLRLAIQDLSPNGNQPMWSEDGNICIIFNGEIYNHLEIRQGLKNHHVYKSTGDTETVLYGFSELGTDVFKKLNGIFALAIYIKDKKKLILARDQFGIKPLYYYQDKKTFLFSSEIKAFYKYKDFASSLDYCALANYISFLYSPGEDTAFKNVKKLLPGHILTITENKFVFEKFYELPFKGIYANHTEQEWIELLDDKLTKAVERQMLSDVPIGFFLSGGLDSSLIVAIAKKLLPDSKLKCYTIDSATNSSREGFTEDLPYAKKVAKYLNVDLEIVKADIDIVRDFDKMIYHLDEPQADAAPLNVMNICQKAREQGRIVLLGGTAGDDLFSGYRRHQALELKKKLRWIPEIILKQFWNISNFIPFNNAFSRRVNKLFSLYQESEKERQFATLYTWLQKDVVTNLFNEELKGFDPVSFLTSKLVNISNEKSLLNKLLYWELKYFLADHNLNYTDKMSMAYGVEVRVPFLDLELVEFSTTIPPELKMKGMETKYLLKKVAEKYLPKDVIYRSKSGFGAPVRDWVINDLDAMIKDRLSKENLLPIFNYNSVQKLIWNNKIGKIDASYSIWALLSIASFVNQFSKFKDE